MSYCIPILNATPDTLSGHANRRKPMNNEDKIIAQALSIASGRIAKGQAVTSTEAASNYLSLKIGSLEYEVFVILHLNNMHEVIECEELFRGTIDQAAVYPREVVKSALYKNTSAIILAHNHISGQTEPSQSDIQITERLVDALKLIDVRVIDHIIVSGGNSTSFAASGLI